MKNARFWVFKNGSWCKLTLTPGQSLTHETYSPSDEGYFASSDSWTYDDGELVHQYASDARDCDGRFSTDGEVVADPSRRIPLARPARPGDPPEGVPDWQPRRFAQRDYSAEAAGY